MLEYKVNEISNKNFYIKEHNQKYNFKELKQGIDISEKNIIINTSKTKMRQSKISLFMRDD